MQQKIEAEVVGLCVGFLPRHRIQPLLAAGERVELAVEPSIPPAPLQPVWKAVNRGRALRWFIEEMSTHES